MSRLVIRRILYAVTIGASLFGAIKSYNPDYSDTIRIVANSSPLDEDYHGVEAFKKAIAEQTNAMWRVHTYPYGQFCSTPKECIDFLENGLIDVFMTTGGGLGNVFGPGQIVGAPYLFSNDAIAECVVDGPFKDYFRQAVFDSGLNIRLMEIGNTGGWRSFATTSRPVRTVDDLKNIKIRTTAAAMQQVFVNEIGAAPTPIAWSELYVAMATGVVDGTTNSLPDLISANLHEQVKYITLDDHGYMAAIWWLSEDRWQRSSPQQRQMLEKAYAALKAATRRAALDNTIKAQDTFRNTGGEIIVLSDDERAGFQAAGQGIRPWFAEQFGESWFVELDRSIDDCQSRLTSSSAATAAL